jgi:opacity protein-like surface antigen
MVALRFKGSVVAVITSFAAVGVVHSADLTVPPLAPVQDFSGWYLRGDTGFGTKQAVSPFDENFGRFESAHNKRFDAAPFFGLGDNWLRLDVTGEYRAGANFHGLDIGDVGGAFMPDRYTGSKYEWTFLFNSYLDRGTWWNFTPFLGAGFSLNTSTNFDGLNEAVGADARSSAPSDIAGHQAWPAAELRRLRFTATTAAQQGLGAID